VFPRKLQRYEASARFARSPYLLKRHHICLSAVANCASVRSCLRGPGL